MSPNEQLDEMGESARALMALGQLILALPAEQAEALKPTLAQLIAAIQREFGQLIAERALARDQRDEAYSQLVSLWHEHSAGAWPIYTWMGDWTEQEYFHWVETNEPPVREENSVAENEDSDDDQ